LTRDNEMEAKRHVHRFMMRMVQCMWLYEVLMTALGGKCGVSVVP